MQAGEGQLHVRLDAHRTDDGRIRCRRNQVFQQRRLPDPCLAPQHQRPALATPDRRDHVIQKRAFARPTSQPPTRVSGARGGADSRRGPATERRLVGCAHAQPLWSGRTARTCRHYAPVEKATRIFWISRRRLWAWLPGRPTSASWPTACDQPTTLAARVSRSLRPARLRGTCHARPGLRESRDGSVGRPADPPLVTATPRGRPSVGASCDPIATTYKERRTPRTCATARSEERHISRRET